jgi:hypothetical protein
MGMVFYSIGIDGQFTFLIQRKISHVANDLHEVVSSIRYMPSEDPAKMSPPSTFARLKQKGLEYMVKRLVSLNCPVEVKQTGPRQKSVQFSAWIA